MEDRPHFVREPETRSWHRGAVTRSKRSPQRNPETDTKTPLATPARAKAASSPDLALQTKLAKIRAAALEAGVELAPGAPPERIASAERAMRVSFPPEVRAYFAAFDGGPRRMRCLKSHALLGLDEIVEAHADLVRALEAGDFFENESSADKGVQPKMWDPAWIPFSRGGATTMNLIDLAPGPTGKVGQIISFDRDMIGRRRLAPSLLTHLQKAWWLLAPW